VSLAVNQDLIASSETPVVVGLGLTGLSCARHFQRTGQAFTVADTRAEPPGLDQFHLDFPGVPVFVGEASAQIIEGASVLVVSPGVSLDDSRVSAAQTAGAQVLGDIDLFMREARAPVIGITGSNAKSTVTELVGQMARGAGAAVAVGGNLGVPALDLLDPDCELYVLELSSFQLERAGTLKLKVATVLNMSADHLDRHGDMPAYHRAKHRIFQGCEKAVVNLDDVLTKPLLPDWVELVSWRLSAPELRGFGLRTENDVEYLSRGFELLLPVEQIAISGRHNVANALAALAIGSAAGLPMPAMLNALRLFGGLPHRCELVAVIDDVRYVNDSKGTNIGATAAALEGLGEGRNIVLIAGGQGKGADFSQLLPAVLGQCKLVILMGEAQQEMLQIFSGSVDVLLVGSMQQAVQAAAEQASAGDCVLLAPACASFDMFSGYAERGDAFTKAVLAVQEASL
jgi:UDP-N-acetylmuramoylalanine--D-glutamate ligase